MRRIISWRVCALFIVCILISFQSISANEKEEKEYIYDDSGRVIEVILSNGDREIYSYDENGNLTPLWIFLFVLSN